MKPEELAAACQSAIDRGSKTLTVVLPGLKRGNSRRLAGRRGPMGEIVCDSGCAVVPSQVVAFDPVAVMAFLVANGLAVLGTRACSGSNRSTGEGTPDAR